MGKFLFIQSRPEKEVSDNEFQAFCYFKGEESEVERLRMHENLPEVSLHKYDGLSWPVVRQILPTMTTKNQRVKTI